MIVKFAVRLHLRHTRRSSGFSLLELLIVCAITSILFAVVLPNMLDAVLRARISQAKANANGIAFAIRRYHADYGQYPTMGGPEPFFIGDEKDAKNPLLSYLPQMPEDPFFVRHTGKISGRIPLAKGKRVWQYGRTEDGEYFIIESMGPDEEETYPSAGDLPVLAKGRFWRQQYVNATYDPRNGLRSEGDITLILP